MATKKDSAKLTQVPTQENKGAAKPKAPAKAKPEAKPVAPAPKTEPKAKEPKPEPVKVTLTSGAEVTGPVTTIKCADCGAERVIKIQDAFQVTRCCTCQKRAVRARRYEKKKAKLAEARAAAKAAEAQTAPKKTTKKPTAAPSPAPTPAKSKK